MSTQRTVRAVKEVEAVVAKADDVVATVTAAERRVAALESKATWTAVGRMGLALLPLTAVLPRDRRARRGCRLRRRVRPASGLGLGLVHRGPVVVAKGAHRHRDVGWAGRVR